MRLRLRELCAFAAIAALSGCTCTEGQTQNLRFACNTQADCAEGFVCRGGECRPDNQPPGACLPSDPPRSCTVAGCQQTCGADGGFGPCAPASGGPFETNAAHCGECGRTCSDRLGAALTCIGSRCTCVLDSDCPAGTACNAGGVCVIDTDSCVNVNCPLGEVCRNGTCAVEPCASGCEVGEVCDGLTDNCRPIGPCRLPTACADGGYCEGDPKPDGEACDDGNACSHTDVCVAGACTGTTYSCGAPNACQLSVACAGDGGCDSVARPDGTGCDDGNACTFGDGCASGACTGTSYTCTPGACDQSSVCGGDGGCVVTPRAAGAACNDGNVCSFADVCNGDGGCGGTAYTCPAPTPCQQAVACDSDGGCLITNKAVGAACDDGQACTANDTCNASLNCTGTPTTTYLDADGDGRGDSNIPQNVCPADAGWVAVGGDCNDGNASVFQVMNNVVADLDQDGYTTGTGALQCVGASQLVNGRTYYRDASGNYTWLAVGDSLGTDCNDGDGDVFVSMAGMAADADNDGYYVGTAATACVGSSSTVNGRTYYKNPAGNFAFIVATTALGGGECNDADTDVYRTVASLGADADQDGYLATSPAVGSQCVGDTSVVNTRTYYRNVSGTYTWLSSPGLGTDCNDASAAVLGPTLYYQDVDGDTFGGATSQSACSSPGAGWVTNTSDCNDASNQVFQTVASLVTDADQDGYSTGAAASQCVGTTTTVGGRTYYRATSGSFTWLPSASSLGTDCNEASANVFTSLASSATDADNDGYYVGSLATNCVGSTSVVNGRTYYRNTSGTFTFIAAGALGAGECNDANATIFRTVASLYTDVDQDGYTVGSAASQCVGLSTVVGGRTYYQNSAGSYVFGSTSLGNDCNDGSAAVLGPTNWYVDGDLDGVGTGAPTSSCTQPAGMVASGTDCNDANINIFQTRTVYVDTDHDGFATATSPTSQCVGSTSVFNGRTYYRDSVGLFPWILTTLGLDCDDTTAAIGARYVDADGDGYGAGASNCAGTVTNNSDCNDANASLYQSVANLRDDSDQDGYSNVFAGTQCVGNTIVVGTRTYYRDAAGVYRYTTSYSGSDCNTANGLLFTTRSTVVCDGDRDGYPAAPGTPFSACAGATSSVGGRTYYYGTGSTPTCAYFMPEGQCLNYQGNGCRDPQDVDDNNASIH